MSRFDHIVAPEAVDGHEEARPGPERVLSTARTALEHGAFEAALRFYSRALEQDRGNAEAWIGQVRALLGMGQPEEAARWLEQAAAQLGERPTLHALRALASLQAGRLDDARAWSDRALQSGRDDPEVWLARAAVVYGDGQPKMGRVNLDKAHERAPGPLGALHAAEVALHAGDLPTARVWLDRARRADDTNPRVALGYGVYWERVGDLAQARQELERALALEPRMTSARVALEDLSNRGVWSRVASALRRWLGGEA